MTFTVKDPTTAVKSRKYMPGMILPNGKEVIECVGRNEYKQPLYAWRCTKCGKAQGPCTTPSLSRPKFSKCCPPRYEAKSNYQGYGLVSGWKIAAIKHRAKKAGRGNTVTAKYLWELWNRQQGRCALTGRKLSLSLERASDDASVDRIDSTKGYVPGNVQWVHVDVNKMKLDKPEAEFVDMCREVVEYAEEKKRYANLDS